MFNLDSSIVLWKNEFYKNESFTNDDIEELEVHLLDKIQELMGTGLSEEEAFIKSTDNIGTSDALNDDFNIVNKMKVISKRIFLCLCGYIFIVYMRNIITAITFGIILPFEKHLADVPSNLMPTTGSILIDISFSLSVIFGIALIYLILTKNLNIIKFTSDKLNNIIDNKFKIGINIVIIPILILAIPRIITSIAVNNMEQKSFGELNIGSNLFENIFNLMLIITFIYCLYKKSENSKDSFWILGGYLTGSAFTNIIPQIVDNTILLLNIKGIVFKIVYLTLYILIIGGIIYTSIFIRSKVYTKTKYKSSIDKSKKVKILLGLLIFITYEIVLVIAPVIHLKELLDTCAMSFIVEVMAMKRITNIIIIILVQVIVNVMLIKRVKLKRRIA